MRQKGGQDARLIASSSRSAGVRTPPCLAWRKRASRSIRRVSSKSTRRGRPANLTIYAIGDVVGEPMLAHKASHEARVAIDSILGERVAFEPEAIPAVVFTDPEVAWCGLTENEAAKQKREVTVTRFPWGASGRAITLDRTDGMTKLVIDPQIRARPRRRHRRTWRRRADCRGRPCRRDGRDRCRSQVDDPCAPDTIRNSHGSRRSVLRGVDARLQAEEVSGWRPLTSSSA